MSDYNIYLTNDAGVRIPTSADGTLASLNTILSMEATRDANRVGTLHLRVPATFNPDLLQRDCGVQIWRAPRGGRMSLWRPYFIRRWRFSSRDGTDQVEIWGYCPNYLLTARIVANYAGEDDVSAFSSEYADDAMKKIVTDSQSDSLSPATSAGTRDWDDFSVHQDLSDGPQLSFESSLKRLLTMSGAGVLPKISAASRVAGDEVFFDVAVSDVSATSIEYEFRTYTDQPGADLSSGNNRVLFSQRDGSLRNPSLEYDYTDEISYVYAGGQGVGENRNVQQVYDSDRYLASRWARREGFADARNQDIEDDDAVRESGRALLNSHRGRVLFSGELVDTEATRFGADWSWGDRVVAKYRNREVDVIVRTVALVVQDGRETVVAKIND
jgi:hypothetical protein